MPKMLLKYDGIYANPESMQRWDIDAVSRINVAATSWLCTDVDATLYKCHVATGKCIQVNVYLYYFFYICIFKLQLHEL